MPAPRACDSNLTQAWDINPQAEIVGYFRNATTSKVHGFLRSRNGEFSAIDFPGATKTQAFGINPSGEVVGAYVDSTGKTHGFLRTRSLS